MKKSDKPLVVKNLSEQIKSAKSVTVIDYQGMPTKTSLELRQKIRAAGGTVLVAKNTLLKLAFEDNELQTANSIVKEGLEGPSAVVFAQTDEVAPLQVIGKSIKDTELPRLKFGLFNGEFIDSAKLLTLSKLPSRNVLVGQLLGALVAPKYALVGTLQSSMQQLIFVLSQASKRENQVN